QHPGWRVRTRGNRARARGQARGAFDRTGDRDWAVGSPACRGQGSGEKRRGVAQVREQGGEAWRKGDKEEGRIENPAQDLTQTRARQQQSPEARRSFRRIEEG